MKALMQRSVLVRALLELLPAMKKAVLMVGVPGSGKTTFAHELASDGTFLNIGFERFIAHAHTVSGQLADPEAFLAALLSGQKQYLAEAATAFRAGTNVVLDNSHHLRKIRQMIAEMASAQGYEVFLVFMLTPVDLCLYRNRQRPGKGEPMVDESFISEMYIELARPENIPVATDGQWLILAPVPGEPEMVSVGLPFETNRQWIEAFTSYLLSRGDFTALPRNS